MSPGRRIEYGAWLIGAVLLILFSGARLWAESSRVRGLEALRDAAAAADSASTAVDGPKRGAHAAARPAASSGSSYPDKVDHSAWSEQRARGYAKASAAPDVPIGALLIPSIRLEVPVYSGASELNLNRGAAHIEGTSPLGADGNIGIAAHRDGFFRGLESLHVDAEVVLVIDGQTVRYRVVEMRIVEPTDVHVLARTETPSVTLVTCYPFHFVGNAPERYIVRAEAVDTADGLVTASLGTSVRQPQKRGTEP